MIAGMNPVAESLFEGISGVPSDVTDDLAVAVGTFTATSQLVMDCLQPASAVSDREALISGATSESQQLGPAISELVPYSNMTIEELTARLG